jgi:Rod binding domain-containing protein
MADGMTTPLGNLPLFALEQAGGRAYVRDSVTTGADPARKAAVEFEAVLLTQIIDEMFAGLDADGPFGGGMGEKMFRGLMNEKIAGSIARQGGVGIADAVYKELLQMQEAKAQVGGIR